jgi:hypothetical protein
LERNGKLLPFLGAEMDVFVLCSNFSDLEKEEGRWFSADRRTWKERTCAIGAQSQLSLTSSTLKNKISSF